MRLCLLLKVIRLDARSPSGSRMQVPLNFARVAEACGTTVGQMRTRLNNPQLNSREMEAHASEPEHEEASKSTYMQPEIVYCICQNQQIIYSQFIHFLLRNQKCALK